MKLKELDMLELMPQYMLHDKTARGIAYAITKVLHKYIINNIEQCNILGRIDKLDSLLLDELAWQFNIPEYITTLDINTKREIVKNGIKTHKQRGTVAAVENILTTIFGNGRVEEWFSYGGEPFHFKIHTTNIGATDSMIDEFNRVIKLTKNARSVLEAVIIEASFDMDVYQGIYTRTIDNVYIY